MDGINLGSRKIAACQIIGEKSGLSKTIYFGISNKFL